MRNIFTYIFAFLITAFVLSSLNSCRRVYEDGPTISFLSRESRVINEWKMAKFYRNDFDYTKDFTICDFTFEKGGNAKTGGNFKWSVRMKGDSVTMDTVGIWHLVSKDRQLQLTLKDPIDAAAIGQAELYMDVDRLYSKEMWLRYQIKSDYYFVQLVSK